MPNPGSFQKLQARFQAQRQALIAFVAKEIAVSGGFALPWRKNLQRGLPERWVTVTPSTRPGIDWQLTQWEGDPLGPSPVPTGHIDIVGGYEQIAKELADWIDPV